jgi:hypothetical protein
MNLKQAIAERPRTVCKIRVHYQGQRFTLPSNDAFLAWLAGVGADPKAPSMRPSAEEIIGKEQAS